MIARFKSSRRFTVTSGDDCRPLDRLAVTPISVGGAPVSQRLGRPARGAAARPDAVEPRVSMAWLREGPSEVWVAQESAAPPLLAASDGLKSCGFGCALRRAQSERAFLGSLDLNESAVCSWGRARQSSDAAGRSSVVQPGWSRREACGTIGLDLGGDVARALQLRGSSWIFTITSACSGAGGSVSRW